MNDQTIARPRACSNPARPSPRSTRGADVAALLRAFGFDGDEIALACSPLAVVLRSVLALIQRHSLRVHSWERAEDARGPTSAEVDAIARHAGDVDRDVVDAALKLLRSIATG